MNQDMIICRENTKLVVLAHFFFNKDKHWLSSHRCWHTIHNMQPEKQKQPHSGNTRIQSNCMAPVNVTEGYFVTCSGYPVNNFSSLISMWVYHFNIPLMKSHWKATIHTLNCFQPPFFVYIDEYHHWRLPVPYVYYLQYIVILSFIFIQILESNPF